MAKKILDKLERLIELCMAQPEEKTEEPSVSASVELSDIVSRVLIFHRAEDGKWQVEKSWSHYDWQDNSIWFDTMGGATKTVPVSEIERALEEVKRHA